MFVWQGGNLKGCDRRLYRQQQVARSWNLRKHAKTEMDLRWAWGTCLARLRTREALASFSQLSAGFAACLKFLSARSCPEPDKASGLSCNCGYITGAKSAYVCNIHNLKDPDQCGQDVSVSLCSSGDEALDRNLKIPYASYFQNLFICCLIFNLIQKNSIDLQKKASCKNAWFFLAASWEKTRQPQGFNIWSGVL